MTSKDRLDILREQNTDLLNQLKLQREKLERLRGRCQSGTEDGAAVGGDPRDIRTLTHGNRDTARAALAKPTVNFADTNEAQGGIQHTIPAPSLKCKHREASTELVATEAVNNSNGHLQDLSRIQDTRPVSAKPCLFSQRRETEKESKCRVSFQPVECDEFSALDSHHLQPLLGYDWIAGVLESKDSVMELPDKFFNELHTFRSLNKDECHHRTQAEFSENNYSGPPLLSHKDDPEANVDSHKCIFSYRINSRLFPVPLHPQECCPVCKKHKSSHPHTSTEPALIRVSITRSAILPSFQYKAHRRCSFDSSDSLGLPSHCLAGWSKKGQCVLPQSTSLDLRSNLKMKNSTDLQNTEPEAFSIARVSANKVSDMTRLARHNFQHFSHKQKLGSASYTLH